MTQMVASQPLLAQAVRQAGLSAREYSVAQLALFQSMVAGSFMKSGAIRGLPKDGSSENVKFLQEHEAEITPLMARLEKLGKEPN